MKILVTANTVPFLHGGADYHINGLTERAAERRGGKRVETGERRRSKKKKSRKKR